MVWKQSFYSARFPQLNDHFETEIDGLYAGWGWNVAWHKLAPCGVRIAPDIMDKLK